MSTPVRPHPVPPRLACFLAAVNLCTTSALDYAATGHALMLRIREYATDKPLDDLQGIDVDASHTRSMALRMGGAAGTVRELADAELTDHGLRSALADVERELEHHDSLFLCFSGHGTLFAYPQTDHCIEGSVLRHKELVLDCGLEEILQALVTRARQLVILDQSCRAGGAATKLAPVRFDANLPAQVTQIRPGTRLLPDGRPVHADTCAISVNALKDIELRPDPTHQCRCVYLAAAAADEYASTTFRGSRAALAWNTCRQDPVIDINRTGAITASEFNACAELRPASAWPSQTLNITGSAGLPLVSLAGGGVVDRYGLFEDIVAWRDETIQAWIRKSGTGNSSLRVGNDRFRLELTLSRPGHLNPDQAGSEGTISPLFLFPDCDETNHMPAGTHVPTKDSRYSYPFMFAPAVCRSIAVLTSEEIDVLKAARKRDRHTARQVYSFTRGIRQSCTARWGTSPVL